MVRIQLIKEPEQKIKALQLEYKKKYDKKINYTEIVSKLLSKAKIGDLKC